MEFTNSIKKYLRSLHQNKNRQKYDKFIAEGPKVCKEFLMCKAYDIEYILGLSSWIESNSEILVGYEDRLLHIKSKELQQISLLKTPNQVVVVVSKTITKPPKSVGWSLFLDRIQDPGNMGTMIRIADWYSMSTIFASPECVDFYNPKVVQGAMGSHNRVKLLESNQEAILALNQPIYGLVLGGQDIRKIKPTGSGIIAKGNESKGLSSVLIENLDYKCTIQRLGGAESLNAAIACGIACQTLIS